MRGTRYSGFLFLCFFLLINQNCVEGFDKIFAFENEASKDGDLSIAKMQLPNSQEGLLFQLHTPIHIYGQAIEKFTVMKNGLLALDGDALKSLSTNYPEQTASSGQRLHDLNERFLSTFSSVNDGPSGMVTVREVQVTKPDNLGCVNAIQLARVHRLISVGHPDENHFTANSLVAIFWENMTNSIYGDSKSNSYTLLILTDGSKSYAVLQYISVEWPEKDITVSSAKPPEAGIFMKHPNGFQLPRSGQSVEVFKWTNETNVAVPGEWIFPLHDTQTDTDAALHHFPSIASEFTKQLKKNCHIGVDGTGVSKNAAVMSDGTEHLNDQPKSAESEVLTEVTPSWDTDRFPDGIDDYYDYDGLEDDWPPSTDSMWPVDVNDRTGNNTEADVAAVLPEFGLTVPIMPEVVEETEIPMGVYDGDGDRMNTEEPGIVPKTFIPQDAELGFVTQGSMESPSEASSAWEMRTDRLPEPRPFETPTEPYVMARSIEPRVSYDERCDAAAECKVTDSECFRVQGLACCVCRDGYYGSGNHKCYSQENDHNYAFKGTLKLKLIPDETMKEIPVYLDIQVGKNPRSSSGLRGIDPHLHEFHSIRFLMPIFHLLDGLIATSCSSDPDVGRARTYNLFSLGSAFQEEFKLQFVVHIEGVGRMSVIARLRVEDEYSSSYSRGTLDMEVTATEPFTLVTRSYTEGTYRNNDQGRNYYTSYHVDNYGRIIFSEQPTAFSAESRGTTTEEIAMDELVVRWSGTGEVSSPGADNPAAGCLLQSGSPVPKNQHFYLRMQERGYCGVDCSSPDGLCNLYCVDVTSVHAREPDACTCIHCQREGEICKPAGSSYSCDCAPGLLRMVDQTCQADASGSVYEHTTEQCGPVYCHQFARCIEPQQGFCQCMPGYRGDGVSRCEDDPCSRCQRNEVCVNDVCKPSGVDLCEGIQCGKQAVCRDGACICNPGYTGDPMVECLEERDRCYGVRCHENARCYDGVCQCVSGYEGDGYYECRLQQYVDPCAQVACHPFARCRNGYCECVAGFEGDGYYECRRIRRDPCLGVQCHRDGYCVDGECRCREGFRGDGYWECDRNLPDPCAVISCHPNATCHNGLCLCSPGFSGDGYRDCRPTTDPCNGVQCHQYGVCEHGRCRCIKGYEGDGVFECRYRDMCDNVQCHYYGECHMGRCQCRQGYEGDGYWDCRPRSSDSCDGIRCHQYGKCEYGRCRCIDGYEGDGLYDCRPAIRDPCDRVRCHTNARCVDGHCRCEAGFEGDGYYFCNRTFSDPCEGIYCHQYGRCEYGRCRCLDGYEGDGRYDCRPSSRGTCGGHQCHPNARCVDGRCRCEAGFEGDGYYSCKSTSSDPCDGIRCHQYARCEYGQCRCMDGYEGDGHYECRLLSRDPCEGVRCHSNARCVNGQCQCEAGFEGDGYYFCNSTSPDLCRDVRCHYYAECYMGQCRCIEGYEGDGHWECQPKRSDPCEGVQCHQYARCEHGRCRCMDGYEGDGQYDCRPMSRDPCEGIRCHMNARCINGRCQCDQGFEGDGYYSCNQTVLDLCEGVVCHQNAHCRNGQCVCNPGYEGDGYWRCSHPREPEFINVCKDVRCHKFAYCDNGRCVCRDGFQGDGYWSCTPRRDLCADVRCHPNARCEAGYCHCLVGYEGDGYRECRELQQMEDPCTKVQCHTNARCEAGECRCVPGYTGDGYRECRPAKGDLCAGVQCHAFGQCYENRCYCSHGYVGDGVNFCDPRTDDPCDNVRCAANAACHGGICSCNPGYRGDGYHECRLAEDPCAQVRCHQNAYCEGGVCRCMEGFQGDGVYECQPRMAEDLCSKVQCHPDADCYQGQCMCRPGYVGDGYRYCHYSGWGQCIDQNCHPYAHCVNDRCQCKPGFEGDGYSVCTPSSSVDPSRCENCRGIPLNELAQCINGRCVCAQGFIESRPGTCTECVPSDCHVNAACLPNAQYGGVYSCQCKSGYSGDGVKNCDPDRGVGPELDPTCGGGCYVRNSECNRLTGRCECRHGYDGDGRISCTWNCQLCLPKAICDRENERCTCMEGYYGDGQTFCERITPQPEPVTVQITGQGDVIRVADLQKPLTLFCYVTTKDESITGQWTQPKGAQPAEVSMNRLPTGLEIQLRIAKPALTDAGRYYCRAKQAEAYIDVAIHETAMPYDIFLTSDDGILKVRSSGQNSTVASLWNLAENNKYARVAMVTDCNRQSVIYTCDFGNTIRWGNAHHTQKELSTSKIYQSQLARFRNLAVDPPSGNIYAWDEAASQMIVLNPDKPHMKHTLSNIGSFKQGEPVRLAGMALHSSRGLLYWAAFTDGWMPNGTIQVASMAGENERQLLQLNGEPLALSLSPSYDDMDKSAGRLCWIQRSITNVFALATEMHCARLSEDGRSVIMQERLRQFNPTEEPSWGLVHHRGTVLWTDASKPVYYSANPARRVHVRLVCCSNRFQSIATLAVCNPGMSNACTYSNGRCHHFCLPGEGQHTRTCVCPDSQPGCHREM